MKPKYEIKTNRRTLQMLFVVMVQSILISTMAVVGLALYLLSRFGVLGDRIGETVNYNMMILLMLVGGFVVGIGLTFLAGKWPLRALNGVLNAMTRLASGDFKTRLNVHPVPYRYPFVKEFTDGFNTMAEELENTEILRSDFVTNFSHEFRTPIASISGFAKLLQSDKLTDEQRKEYLSIIVEESERLASMSTDVMELSRLEKQSILTGETRYAMAEQIRTCLLLLENKWTEKKLELELDMQEVDIVANEQMMQRVWINLLDNAIKYADENGTITIRLKKENGLIRAHITNTGTGIPQESLKQVFTRFYQVDSSHAAKGFGLGLAIVDRIVKMHEGQVAARSGEGWTTFEVSLPDKTGDAENEEKGNEPAEKKSRKK
ncbi:MAG: HAMP domain-containing histidine kinase [Clostridia bacterium]|nr:HAMP domain-containing histidine kinase [Clostridia bacterium]